jgi:hypothetical protein
MAVVGTLFVAEARGLHAAEWQLVVAVVQRIHTDVAGLWPIAGAMGLRQMACGCGRHATTESASLVSGHRFPRDVILLAVRYYLSWVPRPNVAVIVLDRQATPSGSSPCPVNHGYLASRHRHVLLARRSGQAACRVEGPSQAL